MDSADLTLLGVLQDTGTVRRAAAVLGLPRSTVSRQLQAVEDRLGEAVFARRGRTLSPTPYGTALLLAASRARHALEELEALSAPHRARHAERLVVAAPALWVEYVLADVVAELGKARPHLAVELRPAADELTSPDERADVVVLRGSMPPPGAWTARRLGKVELRCLGARQYAERPPRELPWIQVGPTPLELPLDGAGRLPVVPRFVAGTERAAARLAVLGAGVARLSAFFVRDAVDRGALHEILPEARAREDVVAWVRAGQSRAAAAELVKALAARTRSLKMVTG